MGSRPARRLHMTGGLLALALAAPAVAPPVYGAELPPPVAALVEEARRTVKVVDVAALRAVVDGRRPGLLIDVREPAEFASGHLPGAINIPRGLIEFRIWDHVGYPSATDFDHPVYLYCKAGSRCLLAARSLQQLGFRRVFAAGATLEQWSASGGPLVVPAP